MGGIGSGRKRRVGRPKGSWTVHPPKRGRPRKGAGRPRGIHTPWSKYRRANRR